MPHFPRNTWPEITAQGTLFWTPGADLPAQGLFLFHVASISGLLGNLQVCCLISFLYRYAPGRYGPAGFCLQTISHVQRTVELDAEVRTVPQVS